VIVIVIAVQERENASNAGSVTWVATPFTNRYGVGVDGQMTDEIVSGGSVAAGAVMVAALGAVVGCGPTGFGFGECMAPEGVAALVVLAFVTATGSGEDVLPPPPPHAARA